MDAKALSVSCCLYVKKMHSPKMALSPYVDKKGQARGLVNEYLVIILEHFSYFSIKNIPCGYLFKELAEALLMRTHLFLWRNCANYPR